MSMQRVWVAGLVICVAFSAGAAKPPAKPAAKSKATQRLLEAAASGDEDNILAALAAGGDPNARDEDKATPLILCSTQSLFGKERKIVEAFVKAKAKIDAVDRDGASA